MKRFLVLINTLALFFVFARSEAQEVFDVPSRNGNSALACPLAEVRYELQASVNRFQSAPSSVIVKEEDDATTPQRSVKKAFLFSAILPGAGQLYNRSYITALAFLGVEIGAWSLHAKYNHRGNELTEVFELYADTHWSEQRYWDSLARDSGGKCSTSDRTCLKDYQRDSFSHFLPDTKNQTYYENIGKYDQFNAGWDDSKSGEARQRDSANREAYTYMRLDANKQFKNATRATTVVLVNHLLSAVHAAYTTYHYNQKIKTSVGMKMENHNRELVPTLHLGMAW